MNNHKKIALTLILGCLFVLNIGIILFSSGEAYNAIFEQKVANAKELAECFVTDLNTGDGPYQWYHGQECFMFGELCGMEEICLVFPVGSTSCTTIICRY